MEEKKQNQPEVQEEQQFKKLDFEDDDEEQDAQQVEQGEKQIKNDKVQSNENEDDYQEDNDQYEIQQKPIKKKKKGEHLFQLKLHDAKELLDMCKYHNKLLKLSQYDIPQQDNIVIYDISLGVRIDEDRVFADNPEILLNVRRGNSVIEVLNKDKKSEEFIIIRRGLQKFFDIYLEYLDYSEKSDKVRSSHLNTSKLHDQLKEAAIGNPNRILLNNQSLEKEKKSIIHIYKLEKANGENAQVSYFKKFGYWVIASKNVSLLAKNLEDLKSYENAQRYSFAILIAQQWFQMIAKLNKEQLEQLQAAMDGYTFVGEYCGNQNYQHLIRYNEINIKFYAIVDHKSSETCISPEQSQKIFQKFGLNTVKFEHLQADSIQQFQQLVFQIYQQVGHSSIEEQGEGCVLYFVSEDPNHKFQTQSLCKVKTIEYRLYRKLREKIKSYLSKAGNKNYMKVYEDYCKQSKELCEFVEPVKPLAYYFSVAKAAFENLKENKAGTNGKDVSNKYVDYLEKIKQIVATQNQQQQFTISQSQGSQEDSKQAEEQKSSIKLEPDQQQLQLSEFHRIIIISPPYYLTTSVLNSIAKDFNVNQIEKSWNENQEIITPISIVHLNIPPHLKSAKKEIKNTFFLILGFSEKLRERVQKQMEDNRESFMKEQKSDNQIKPYMNSKNMSETLTNKHKQIIGMTDELQHCMPEKFEFVEEDIYKFNSETKKIDEESGCAYMKAKIIQILQKFQSMKKQELIQMKSTKQKKLLVFVPLTIPATGKSYVIEKAKAIIDKDNNYSLRIISSDQIRRDLMDNLKKTKNIQDDDELFKQTGKKAGDIFFTQLQKMVEQTETLESEFNILFIDKNHPVNNIDKTVQTIRDGLSDKIKCKIVAIQPQCYSKFSFQDGNTLTQYGFSLFYLLTCIHRAINRNDHLTLKGDTYKIAEIVLMFFNFFKNFNFSLSNIKTKKMDYIIQLPYHIETQETEKIIPETLRKSVSVLLKHQQLNQENLDTFITEFISSDMEYKYPDIEEQIKIFMKSVQECFKLFDEKN